MQAARPTRRRSSWRPAEAALPRRAMATRPKLGGRSPRGREEEGCARPAWEEGGGGVPTEEALLPGSARGSARDERRPAALLPGSTRGERGEGAVQRLLQKVEVADDGARRRARDAVPAMAVPAARVLAS